MAEASSKQDSRQEVRYSDSLLALFAFSDCIADY